MAKKSDSILRLWLLFFMATASLAAGWIMKSLPVFIFVGLAPLFGIADRANNDENLWGSSELILMALTVSLLSAHFFDMTFLVPSISQAIVMTLAFIGYAYVYQNLGFNPGKLTLIILWLGMEYLFLKLPFRESIVFLGDALQLKSSWLRWNAYTGYLGASAWILVCNFFLYLALIKTDQKLNGVFLVLALITMAGPVILSNWSDGAPIKRSEMILAYEQNSPATLSLYSHQGEVVARTSAVLSGLILLLALIRNKTQKSR